MPFPAPEGPSIATISGFDTTKSQLYHATRVHLPLVRVNRMVSFACALAVVLAAIVVLAAWAFAPALTALGAGGVPMNSLTAVCLLLLAAGLLFVLPTPHGRLADTFR